MRRSLLAAAMLAGVGVLAAQGQGPAPRPGSTPFDLGPGAGGATLRQPWETAPRPAAPSPSNPLKGLWNQQPAAAPNPTQPYTPSPVDINKDIAVSPAHGAWLVCVITYTGDHAPRLTRQMVSELRTRYKLSAFAYNYAAEEKRKEYERVKAFIEKQRDAFRQAGLSTDQPIRIKRARIAENTGVFVGGYRSEVEARRALEAIHKLDPGHLPRELLDKKAGPGWNPETKKVEQQLVYVNPFQRAFVVHNPTVKVERSAPSDALDLASLKKLNSENSFNLLKCSKRYTLVIKQFQVPTALEERNLAKGFLSKALGRGSYKDYAAENAHNFAVALRKSKLEAYVLHTKFASIVSIGGYDSLEDPNLRSMQDLLEPRLRAMAHVQCLPRAMPMPVPR